MKRFALLSLMLVLALALAACGADVEPTTLPDTGAEPTAAPGAEETAAPGAEETAAPGGETTTASPLQTPAVPALVSGPVRIGSKDFSEELLLGEMYALLLEEAGVPVERRLNLAGTQVAHEALIRGEIDLYPEYTGTGYLFILGIQDNDKDPAVVYEKTADAYLGQWNLVWLEPAPMNNTNAIACTQEAAQQYGLVTLSDLAEAAPNLRFAAIPDFEQRPDGLAGLQATYGGFEFQELTVYDPGLKYKAVTDGQADCVIAFSTDGQIGAYDLVLMEDDQSLWPPYQVAPVVRAEVLAAYPAIDTALNELAPLLTNEVISDLNWQVDGEKREYTDVAREFLQEQGLIQ